MAGFKAADNITSWVKGFFKRKDDKLEKDASKATLTGDSATIQRITDKLYPSGKK
jgi:hypothetical protein